MIPQAWVFVSLAVIVLAIAAPRLLALDRYVTPDEQLWLARSANFYYALGQRDFAATYQQQHPGVTVMWAGTAAFLLKYPEYRGSGIGQVRPERFHRYLAERGDVSALELLAAARRIVAAAQVLILGLAFWYAVGLAGLLPALLGFLLIAFDPFHMGLTRLLHLDGLLSNLVLLSLLALLNYLYSGRRLALVVSGLAAGLGWLTKTPALFLLPAVGLIYLAARWQALRKAWRSRSIGDLVNTLAPLGIWLIVGVLVFFVLWPAMWVQPLATFDQVFYKAYVMGYSGHDSAVYFNGQIYDDGRLGLDVFYFYPLIYLWRATPWALLGLALATPGMLARGIPFDRPASRGLVKGLLLIVLLFTLAFTLPTKKFDRYLLPAFAPLDLLAGFGWSWAAAWLSKSITRRWARALAAALITAVLLLQAASALSTFPYYLNYYNPALGGIQRAAQVMQIGWGEGLDQAARYLNQKPGASKLRVSSWYVEGSFSYFFTGQTRPIPYYSQLTEQEWQDFITSDYAVIYVHQWQRQIPEPILEYVSRLEPEYSIFLNEFEYVQIYKLH